MSFLCCVLAIATLSSVSVAQQQEALPVRIGPVTLQREDSRTCPSQGDLDPLRNAIRSSLSETVVPALVAASTPCQCGGGREWHRIAHLNMSDPNQQCPPNWRLHTTPVRACGAKLGISCNSAVFPASGESYSHVCGRVIAYQKGAPDAFNPSVYSDNPSLEGVYLDGVSLTHGPPGARRHIWSFASARREGNVYSSLLESVCACTNTNLIWPFQVPSFVGNDYFCDTGNSGSSTSFTQVYSGNPLWDGEGCGPASSCCQLNTPPWFCTTLPQPTTDDIELRICHDFHPSDEDALISLVDVYIM